MKKNFKLNALAAKTLSETEMNKVRGGGRSCSCGCQYANSGGSSTSNNCSANYEGGSSGLTTSSPIQCEIKNVPTQN
jgi:natural product precursor